MIFNWKAYLQDHGIKFEVSRKNHSEGWLSINCPHHPNDHDYFMGINPANGASACWICGSKKTTDTIKKHLRIDDKEALIVYAKYLTATPSGNYAGRRHQKGTATELALPSGKFTPMERKYLASRRLDTDSVLDTYDLRGGGIAGFFAFRIVFPIYQDGVIVSATGRSIVGAEPKYLTLPPDKEIITHKETLFGIDLVRGSRVAVVEGPVDVIRGGAGFAGTYGTSVTDMQLAQLSKFDHVMFIRDNDMASRKAVDKYASVIALLSNAHVESIVLDIPDIKDVGDLSDEQVAEVREELRLC